MADVVIAGAGPTGLMLGCELALAGVEVLILERRTGPTGESRAGGLHARTLEVLDQRGMVEPFLAEGRPLSAGHFSGLPLRLHDLPTRYPYLLVLLQSHVERLLAEQASALGVAIRRDAEVTDLRQDTDGVTVTLADGGTVRGRYLVGCDGGRSVVRHRAGIGYPGTDATLTSLLGDVELADPPAGNVFQQRTARGDYSVLGFEAGWYRVMTTRTGVLPQDGPVTLDRLRSSLIEIAGRDFGLHSPRWLSRYGDTARQADRYRQGRVLLAGDAAHIHYPAGGQGLNTGVQDAINLGWKIAAVLRGDADDTLLDTYHDERHPVGARVLDNTRAQVALGGYDAQTEALRSTMAGLIEQPAVNDQLAGMVTALDVTYPLGGGHPLVGRRLPDIDLPDGRRAYQLLHPARPVLLDLGATPVAVPRDRAGAIDHVLAHGTAATWRVPVLGTVPAPAAALVRPDGHIAWATAVEGDTTGLDTALSTWVRRARVPAG
ncbi:putative monooxygenase [Actinocatenispora thailandica]|uniref:Putative monooxygenase n=2 Tax=Actinocatenispora thailandica TaxID=227318 RepID=A0A7R7DTC9_9ACTN|nr:putative monooxygenase [Actinocatenispora thailandica]